MRFLKNKFAYIESDGSLKVCIFSKLKNSNKNLLKEKDYKTFKKLKFNTIEKNIKSKYRKVFF